MGLSNATGRLVHGQQERASGVMRPCMATWQRLQRAAYAQAWVFELEVSNRLSPVIPGRITRRLPQGGADQIDTDSLPDYPILNDILIVIWRLIRVRSRLWKRDMRRNSRASSDSSITITNVAKCGGPRVTPSSFNEDRQCRSPSGGISARRGFGAAVGTEWFDPVSACACFGIADCSSSFCPSSHSPTRAFGANNPGSAVAPSHFIRSKDP